MKKAAVQKGILVLGMHRSGTSLLTGLLHALGVDLGGPLLGAAPENPKGFWEHEEVVALNERALSCLNLSWFVPSAMPTDWCRRPDIVGLLGEARVLLREQFAGFPVWAIKDPRLCRLAPLWLDCLAAESVVPRVIHVLRHPLEVAESLKVRNRIPYDSGVLLWLIYNLEAYRSGRGADACLVTMDRLQSDPLEELRRIWDYLDIAGANPLKRPRKAVTSFLNPAHRHHRADQLSWEEVSPRVKVLAETAYAAFLAACDTTAASRVRVFDELYQKVKAYLSDRRKYCLAEKPERVDVVVPVYRGHRETMACIESVLHNTDDPYELIVVEDACPEPQLIDDLEALAAQGKITLIRNGKNRGFVYSANRGMKAHGNRDVVLLNSDTEVPPNWLERLSQCAYANEWIGTVTPFSNNATICSYPVFLKANTLPDAWSAAALDALFKQANSDRFVDIPTGVGFCMYIRRDALNEIGYFDEKNFGRGYGEENDFCMRLSYSGRRNILCGNLFVYHKGGVSFGVKRETLGARATSRLTKLHPLYSGRVSEFVSRDPLRPMRFAVDLIRIERGGPDELRAVLSEWQQDLASRRKVVETERSVLQQELRNAELALAARDEALQNTEKLARDRLDELKQLTGALKERDQGLKSAEHLVADLRQALRERDDGLARLEKLTLHRAAELDELNAALSARDVGLRRAEELVTSLRASVEERDTALRRTEELVRHAEGLVTELRESAEEKDQGLRRLELVVRQRDAQLGKLDNALRERDAGLKHAEELVTELRRAMEEKDQGIVNLEQILGRQNTQLGKLDAALRERDSALRHAEQLVGELRRSVDASNDALTHAERLVAERGEDIVRLNKALADRDAGLENAEKLALERLHQVETLSRRLDQASGTISAAQGQIEELQTRLDVESGRVADLSSRLEAIEASRGWRFILFLRRVFLRRTEK